MNKLLQAAVAVLSTAQFILICFGYILIIGKKGLGNQLMEKVHDYVRELHCKIATVAVMNFQGAKAFYESIGYECDFERAGYVDGATCIFLSRKL